MLDDDKILRFFLCVMYMFRESVASNKEVMHKRTDTLLMCFI